MRSAVVYESMFGNTSRVARAVAEGLRGAGADVVVVPVNRAGNDVFEAFDLVVIGAPTHAFTLSRPGSRADAVKRGAPTEVGELGVREWLATLPPPARGAAAAVFDTRVRTMRHWPGSAARRAAHYLRRAGYDVAGAPTSFYVRDVEGPLDRGEEARAHDWGADIVHQLTKAA